MDTHLADFTLSWPSRPLVAVLLKLKDSMSIFFLYLIYRPRLFLLLSRQPQHSRTLGLLLCIHEKSGHDQSNSPEKEMRRLSYVIRLETGRAGQL